MQQHLRRPLPLNLFLLSTVAAVAKPHAHAVKEHRFWPWAPVDGHHKRNNQSSFLFRTIQPRRSATGAAIQSVPPSAAKQSSGSASAAEAAKEHPHSPRNPRVVQSTVIISANDTHQHQSHRIRQAHAKRKSTFFVRSSSSNGKLHMHPTDAHDDAAFMTTKVQWQNDSMEGNMTNMTRFQPKQVVSRSRWQDQLRAMWSGQNEPREFFGLPKVFWSLLVDIMVMLAFAACIPFILTVAKRKVCSWCI